MSYTIALNFEDGVTHWLRQQNVTPANFHDEKFVPSGALELAHQAA